MINNWEATYFNFNQEKILSLAEKAKAIDVELMVLYAGIPLDTRNDHMDFLWVFEKL